MVHRIPVAAMVIGSLSAPMAGEALAQTPQPMRVVASAAVASGRVHGLVRDTLGAAIADASVLAVGQAVVSARTDQAGRFQMALAPGDYILRATRDGYVSTYREAVRVVSSGRLERTITLTRQGEAPPAAVVDDSHAHTELAWRLRHLTRSILRDGGAANPGAAAADPDAEGDARRPGSFFERAVDTSARLATALFANTDFTGQVNVVTVASASSTRSFAGAAPRSVAFLVLGAPAGPNGDWRVRGAIASGDEASWNLLGEYESRVADTHALKVGVSYSAQDARVRPARGLSSPVIETRSVAGIFAQDRWRPLPQLELDYAVRADRYDYLAAPHLFSASTDLRARVLPATFVTVGVARTMVAPGADEFLPPPAPGAWLPPERTFSALGSREPLRAETVRHAEVGLTREIGGGDRPRAVHLRAFMQRTAGQMATLFGVSDRVGLGHYHVARVGSVSVTGWAVGFTGTLPGGLTGHVEYARLMADWQSGGRSRGLRRIAPSVIRRDVEWLHDVTASLDAELNDSATRVSVVYRSSDAFSSDEAGWLPFPGGRFDVQVHQALPYRPTRGSRLDVLFAVRTLFRDVARGASRYDELLTVAPPLRLMGGIRVRF